MSEKNFKNYKSPKIDTERRYTQNFQKGLYNQNLFKKPKIFAYVILKRSSVGNRRPERLYS